MRLPRPSREILKNQVEVALKSISYGKGDIFEKWSIKSFFY